MAVDLDRVHARKIVQMWSRQRKCAAPIGGAAGALEAKIEFEEQLPQSFARRLAAERDHPFGLRLEPRKRLARDAAREFGIAAEAQFGGFTVERHAAKRGRRQQRMPRLARPKPTAVAHVAGGIKSGERPAPLATAQIERGQAPPKDPKDGEEGHG